MVPSPKSQLREVMRFSELTDRSVSCRSSPRQRSVALALKSALRLMQTTCSFTEPPVLEVKPQYTCALPPNRFATILPEHDGEVVVERIAEVDALLVPDRAVLRAGRLGKPVAVAGNGGSRSAALELCRCRDGSKREKNPDAVKKKFSQV